LHPNLAVLSGASEPDPKTSAVHLMPRTRVAAGPSVTEADDRRGAKRIRQHAGLGIKPDRLNAGEADMVISEKDKITKALADYHVWQLGNEILYRLCADYPAHSEDNVIITKMWLIGRAYAAAVERRSVKGSPSGDDFYINCLAPKVRNSEIDLWFQKLREDRTHSKLLTLDVHKKLVDLLKPITGLEKRSFASKYLHFHFPDRFFLYDARAVESVRTYVGHTREDKQADADVDRDYAVFFDRCEKARHKMADCIGRDLTPREVDDVLLCLWSKPPRSQR
jgi:hypothetical protein